MKTEKVKENKIISPNRKPPSEPYRYTEYVFVRRGQELSRGQLKCGGTSAETRFRLSAKRTSPFKPAGTSVQPTTGSRGVRISGSNAGYTMFPGCVQGTG